MQWFSMFILLFFVSSAHAAQEVAIPDELKNWVPWVLQGKEETNCPFQYNHAESRHCAWPEMLSLEVNNQGGKFKQSWDVYEQSWIALPGNRKNWPQDITVDGKPTVVVEKKGMPFVQLAKGNYQIAGRFIWNKLPEFINLPARTGLLDVVINEKNLEFPQLEASGRLWLNKTTPESSTAIENKLQLDVFRRVIDDVPLRIITRLDMNVVGQPREIVLGPLLSENDVPLSISGQLPMRLEVDGKLRMQVRPGHWVVHVEARHKTPVDSLSLTPSNLPDNEVWVFDAKPSLRLVEIEGVVSLDPRQTRLPKEWHNLPVYQMSKSDTLQIVTKRRGDPDPVANELTLNRNLWLDFDGSAYTFQDTLTGQMRQGWRLNMSPDMILGRTVVNGVDQLVTRLQDGAEQGIEVRQGEISVQAEGRYQGDISAVPAIGWLDNFTRAQATLHLPPGWQLFAASGVDSVSGASWIDRWSLLDIFLVLIAALAVYRLLGWFWGAVALVCFVFSWHESGAPQYIWLFVIAAIALLRVAPEGRLRKSMVVLRYLSLTGLVVIAIPYMVDTVRTAIYPQLERPDMLVSPMSPVMQQDSSLSRKSDEMLEQEISQSMSIPRVEKRSKISSSISLYSDAIDPRAKVQTGPGLPQWSWQSIPIRWNGPVQAGQVLGLTLMPPALTASIKLVSVFLVLLLGLGLAGITLKGKRVTVEVVKLGIIGLFIGSSLLFMPNQASADIPSAELLMELQDRLLAPPECLPQCAQISRMKLEIKSDLLRILLEVHTSEDVAVPIPSELKGWMPNLVTLDGEKTPTMRGAQNALWLQVPKGIHNIQIAGPIRQVRMLQLPLPLQPSRIEINATGWNVKGVHQDGTIEKALQLEREVVEGEKAKVLEQTVLPSFVTVTRILRLGLEWQIETVVKRLTPLGSAIALEIPLIANESVTTDGIRIAHGKAVIQFAPQQQSVRWQSVLQQSTSISLQAANSLDWIEQWRLDVSPIWHVELDGIPQIHHQSKQGTWFPQWHPWPGEQLSIQVSKPSGVAGKTKTIDRTQLTVKPGQRATDVSLALRLRSSQADQHIIQLPEGATLGAVLVNGKSQPIRQEDAGVVRLPIAPGEQNITLNWQTATGIGSLLETPSVNTGLDSVNANIEIQLPQNRWTLLTFGPQLGPAVLFWGVLIVVVIIAIGLGRTKQTPLKTHQWLLLGIGLSQAAIGVAMLVVGWLFAMAWRKRAGSTVKSRSFNIMQVGLGFLTILALFGLVGAVGFGLLGHPNMQISGNGSSAANLQWYADQSTEILPTATVISAPLWLYRVLMLAWSLWLAFALLGWLKWAWQCFIADGLWRHLPPKSEPIKSKPSKNENNDAWLGGKSKVDVKESKSDKSEGDKIE